MCIFILSSGFPMVKDLSTFVLRIIAVQQGNYKKNANTLLFQVLNYITIGIEIFLLTLSVNRLIMHALRMCYK